MTFGTAFAGFLMGASFPEELPDGIELLEPYHDEEVRRVVREMCERYYPGTHLRIPVLGINPGRFGGGVTGLSFTDPYALIHQLGIPTSLTGRRELSAEYISMVIDAYGGPGAFYHDVCLTACSPLGFVRNGVNINFYDDRRLQVTIAPYVRRWLLECSGFGLRMDVCIVLGTGKLRTFFEQEVVPHMAYRRVAYLEHPRFVMQYRRKRVDEFVRTFVDTIRSMT